VDKSTENGNWPEEDDDDDPHLVVMMGLSPSPPHLLMEPLAWAPLNGDGDGGDSLSLSHDDIGLFHLSQMGAVTSLSLFRSPWKNLRKSKSTALFPPSRRWLRSLASPTRAGSPAAGEGLHRTRAFWLRKKTRFCRVVVEEELPFCDRPEEAALALALPRPSETARPLSSSVACLAGISSSSPPPRSRRREGPPARPLSSFGKRLIPPYFSPSGTVRRGRRPLLS